MGSNKAAALTFMITTMVLVASFVVGDKAGRGSCYDTTYKRCISQQGGPNLSPDHSVNVSNTIRCDRFANVTCQGFD